MVQPVRGQSVNQCAGAGGLAGPDRVRDLPVLVYYLCMCAVSSDPILAEEFCWEPTNIHMYPPQYEQGSRRVDVIGRRCPVSDNSYTSYNLHIPDRPMNLHW